MSEFVMKEAFTQLNDKQIAFLCNEFSITKEDIEKKSEDELNELYERICDIECEETPPDDSDMSERGEMASAIVTIVGNYFAKEYGYSNEEEFDKFLSEEE